MIVTLDEIQKFPDAQAAKGALRKACRNGGIGICIQAPEGTSAHDIPIEWAMRAELIVAGSKVLKNRDA